MSFKIIKHILLFDLAVIALLFLFSAGQRSSKKIPEPLFRKHTITTEFIAEGVTVFDVNKDGRKDIVSGAWWFEAPSWKRHELTKPDTFTYDKGYSTTFINFNLDVNLDGWIDLIRLDQPGEELVWYENPGRKKGHWKMRTVLGSQGNEAPIFTDVDGDGRKDVICNDPVARKVIWLKAPVKKGDTSWSTFVISNDSLRGTHKYTHGAGWGDMNKDGRPDLIIKSGWWESPADVMAPDWVFHPAELGADCGNMYVYDVDQDGDQDVISSSAHNFGIWWHEQRKDTEGKIKWQTHEINKQLSQTHSLALTDMNGDGHPDLVTGKRFFAHNGKDPGAFDPSLLIWFEFKPGEKPQWIPHQIDDNSGVGIQFVIEDINGDNAPDIVTSNKKGLYFFERINNAR